MRLHGSLLVLRERRNGFQQITDFQLCIQSLVFKIKSCRKYFHTPNPNIWECQCESRCIFLSLNLLLIVQSCEVTEFNIIINKDQNGERLAKQLIWTMIWYKKPSQLFYPENKKYCFSQNSACYPQFPFSYPFLGYPKITVQCK